MTVGTPFERDAVSSARNVSRFGIRIGSLKLPLFLHSHAQVFIETLPFLHGAGLEMHRIVVGQDDTENSPGPVALPHTRSLPYLAAP